MEVSALLLIGPDSASSGIAGVPIWSLPIVGAPMVKHVAKGLSANGVKRLSVVLACKNTEGAAFEDARKSLVDHADWNQVNASEDDFWIAGYQACEALKESGCEQILVMRLGTYSEFPLSVLVAFHTAMKNRLTPLTAKGSSLSSFLVSASALGEARLIFRKRFNNLDLKSSYEVRGYINPMANLADLRQLALDTFALRTSIKPCGKELRPGIWVGEGAKIDKGARLVAPAFIGAHARVRASAVVTRGSSLEHHGEVDCGTVVENSSVLPYTYLGPGLEVVHSVVGFKSIANLRRRVIVPVEDPRLITAIQPNAGLRALFSAGALAAYLPQQFVRGIAAKPQTKECPTDIATEKAAAGRPFGVDTSISSSRVLQDETVTSPQYVLARTHGQQ